MKKNILIIGLLLASINLAPAAYDPLDGSSYSCNEGNTPKLCKLAEELATEQAVMPNIQTGTAEAYKQEWLRVHNELLTSD